LSSVDEASSVLFGYDDVAGWSSEELDGLLECGLLRETAHARSVVCDGCEEACLENVEFLDYGDGSPVRAFVVCRAREDIGRVAIPLERLRQWAIDLNALVKLLGQLLATDGVAEEIVEKRLWWLGSWHKGRRCVDFFLAVGAGRPDASAVFSNARQIRECSTPVVLIPGQSPQDRFFGAHAKMLCLARLLTAEGSMIHIDRDEIKETIAKPRAERIQDVAPFPTPPGTTWEQLLIEFHGDEAVRITVGSVVEHKSFGDMGFVNRSKSGEQPDKLWWVLRDILAKCDGEVAWGDSTELSQRELGKVKKWVADIRARLRAYFPAIAGDPFESYRTAKAYKTKFVLRWSEAYRRSRQ